MRGESEELSGVVMMGPGLRADVPGRCEAVRTLTGHWGSAYQWYLWSGARQWGHWAHSEMNVKKD